MTNDTTTYRMARAIDTTTPGSTADAYRRGRRLDSYDAEMIARSRNRAEIDARAAVDSWTAAATDHSHASYYGAATLRVWRAFWLGVLRTTRGTP